MASESNCVMTLKKLVIGLCVFGMYQTLNFLKVTHDPQSHSYHFFSPLHFPLFLTSKEPNF
jgi:hypothetical protein